MSVRRANCPGCGAPVEFAWSSAVQSACPFCRAILVRHDVDLEKVGVQADLPEDASPLQLGVEGIFDNQAFRVVGRLAYAWDQGRWNEWHIIFQNGASGWLSDAQAEYAVSSLTQSPQPLPAADAIRRGNEFEWGGTRYSVTVITRAHYEGFEGELPFTTRDRKESIFADLRSQDAHFATIDYSEDPPLLYLGRAVPFDELRLKGLREFEGW